MRYLRTNTGTRITVGPFVDVTDGITPILDLTPSNCHLTLTVDTAGVPTIVLDTTPTGANVMAHIVGDDAGFYDLTLVAANVNYFGRVELAIIDDDVHLPVFHEFSIVGGSWYDSMFASFGSVCWGHETAVTQENFRAFTVNWSGTGSIVGSGDSERILLSSGKTLTSEIWKVQGDVELALNQYDSGSTPDTIEYRTGLTYDACNVASWNPYTVIFSSLGFVQIRLSMT